MGLIGSYLGALYCGGCGYYLSPFAFLKRPLLWLETVSKYKATHLQAPHFGYALATRRYRSLATKPALNLASIRHMINAAEPISGSDLDAFTATFEPLGLPRGVVFPTYGLAEHTVFVCSGGTQRLRLDKLALEAESRVVERDSAEQGSELVADIVGCGFPGR